MIDMPWFPDHWIRKEERKKDKQIHRHKITTIIHNTCHPWQYPNHLIKCTPVQKKNLVSDEQKSFLNFASVTACVGKLAWSVMHFVAKDHCQSHEQVLNDAGSVSENLHSSRWNNPYFVNDLEIKWASPVSASLLLSLKLFLKNVFLVHPSITV